MPLWAHQRSSRYGRHMPRMLPTLWRCGGCVSGFLGHCSPDVLGGHRINPVWAKRVAALSPDPIIRLSVYWPDVAHDAPPFGSYDWQQTDDNVGVLEAV